MNSLLTKIPFYIHGMGPHGYPFPAFHIHYSHLKKIQIKPLNTFYDVQGWDPFGKKSEKGPRIIN